MAKAKERIIIPVSLPSGLVEELNELVDKRIFGSRSEALRHGAHMVVLLKSRVHSLAEEYAYEEAKTGLKRGKNIS